MDSEREITITEAIDAIQNGQVGSVKAAAAAFGIPRSTLRDRLKGATNRSTAQQTIQRLTAEQERRLIDWIKELEAQGNPPSHTVIREMVSKIETTSNPTSNPAPIGNHWVDRFIHRYPEISSCIGVPLESFRALNSTYDTIQAHFQRVQTLIRKFNILTEDIWNMDETGLAMGLCANGYVVSGQGKRRVYVKTPQNREWVSILEAISASGRSIRPLVVFKGANLQSSWFPADRVPDWHYTTSENGWTSNNIALQWLRDVFIPESRRDSSSPSRTRLLVMDGHGSHISVDFMWECKQNNIQLCFLPAHTSHILQPLDLGCFGPEKRHYRTEIRKMATLNDAAQVQKLQFIQCYEKARAEGLSERNIRSSWKAAGLVPWNPRKVLESSQVMGSQSSTASSDLNRPTLNRKRARSESELLKTPKKPQDLYEAAQTLSSPSRTSRTIFRKAIAGLSVELANAKSTIEALKSQVQGLEKGQRKRVAIDPNQTIANVDSIRNAQKAATAAEVARKAKTKSDNELRLASEQVGSLRMEDMMFEFQI